MPKLTGPLLSNEAHGTIGDILTYSKRHGKNYTRKFNKPLAPPSAKQRGQRRLTEFLVAQWQNMSAAEKASWNALVKFSGLRLSGYHYFLREAQRDLYTHTGLCLFLHCNEIVDGKVLDLSGNQNHGTLGPNYPSNAPTLVPSRSKRFGKALLFDSEDDLVNCGIDNSLKIDTYITIEAWIKPKITGEYQSIYTRRKSTPPRYGWMLYVDPDGYIYWMAGAGGEEWAGADISNTKVTEDVWQHIFFTHDGIEGRIYQNGIDTSRHLWPPETPGFGGDGITTWVGVGEEDGSLFHFKDSLDGVCVYNRTFLVGEITTRYKFAMRGG